MQVKTFSGSGAAGIQKVEDAVNNWLTERASEVRVTDQQTAVCTVADSGAGERSPSIVITIWYVERAGREQGER